MDQQRAVQDKELPSPFSSRILHLILMPTEACNFRCVYCYEEFKYKRMEPSVIRGVKGLLTRRAPGLHSLTLSWFGGEPLLAPDVIEEIMELARSLSEQYPPLTLAADMTTNGYLLTRPMFGRMLNLGVDEYQISFDGPREWHDRKRVMIGGKGTFDRIWTNLLAMRDVREAFTIIVRVHADRQNANVLPEFIQDYKRAFGSDSRFKLFIRELSRLGGPNDSTLEVFDHEEGDRVIGKLRDLARSEGLELADTSPSETMCYATRANSFLVRANGRLNKCTVALEHPNNQVGHILEDGTVELRDEKMAMWMRGLISGDPEALKCPMIGYADGDEKTSSRPRVAFKLTPVVPAS